MTPLSQSTLFLIVLIDQGQSTCLSMKTVSQISSWAGIWEKWSVILDNNSEDFISSIENNKVIDPTWAWDAYRAWLLRWLQMWYNWNKSANIWSLLASYSVWLYWAQNHYINKQDFQKWFKSEFGHSIEI